MTPAVLHGFTTGWNAILGPNGWVFIEPLGAKTEAKAKPGGLLDGLSGELPAGLPERFVILTAANPGGIELGEAENRERHARLLERINGLQPFPRETPVAFTSVGGLPHGPTTATWRFREDGVAIDLSREEASMLADEFGQLAWYSFEGGRRLLVATDDGILATQPYRYHMGVDDRPAR